MPRWGASGWDQGSLWASGGPCGKLISFLHVVDGEQSTEWDAILVESGCGWDQDGKT